MCAARGLDRRDVAEGRQVVSWVVESWQRAYDAYGVAFVLSLLASGKAGWRMGQVVGRWTNGGER